MKGVKAFLARLLQVCWVLMVSSSLLTTIMWVSQGKSDWEVVPIIFITFSVLFIVIQYLIFAKFNPFDLFNGTITQKS